MDNGFSASDAVLTSAMSGGFSGGNLWGNNLVDGTVLNAKIDASADRASDNIAGVRSAFDNQTRNAQFAQVNKNIADSEFRSLDRQRDIEKQLVDNAKESAKCCCETQKLVTAEATATRLLMLEIEGRATTSKLAEVQAKNIQLETINALRAKGH